MTPVRLAALVVTVFVVSLPVTFLMHEGSSSFLSFSADSDDLPAKEEKDDPVVDLLCLKGMQELGNGNTQKAIAHFTKAIERDPNYSFAYIGRGDAYLAGGDSDRAISDYDRAVRTDPSNDVARKRAEAARQVRALE
jgi:tetratricopeptide (TPR) repeat protein